MGSFYTPKNQVRSQDVMIFHRISPLNLDLKVGFLASLWIAGAFSRGNRLRTAIVIIFPLIFDKIFYIEASKALMLEKDGVLASL